LTATHVSSYNDPKPRLRHPRADRHARDRCVPIHQGQGGAMCRSQQHYWTDRTAGHRPNYFTLYSFIVDAEWKNSWPAPNFLKKFQWQNHWIKTPGKYELGKKKHKKISGNCTFKQFFNIKLKNGQIQNSFNAAYHTLQYKWVQLDGEMLKFSRFMLHSLTLLNSINSPLSFLRGLLHCEKFLKHYFVLVLTFSYTF